MYTGQSVVTREHDIDWRKAVEKVVWLPSQYRTGALSSVAARRVLRCSESSFAQLVEYGLPAVEGTDGPLYDRHDVQNVGLLSRTGLTEVELGMRIVLGFMQAETAELTAPRRWQYELTLRSNVEPGARLLRRVYRPMPELVGGELKSCTAEVSGPFIKALEGSSVTGTLVTRGLHQQIRSKEIAAIAEEFFDSGIRWQYLPSELAADPMQAMAIGVGACRTLSATLEQRLVAAGFEARAFRGWMIALSPMGHGWVEVLDDDGVVKWLDPSFALLSTGNGFGSPAFRALVTGSVLNRVVPSRATGDVSLYADGTSDDGIELVCRAAPPERKLRPRAGSR